MDGEQPEAMCPRRFSHTFLQIAVLQVIFIALLIVFIRGITYPAGKYNYEHIPRINIEQSLFEMRSPTLNINTSLPQCDYGFVNSTDTICKEDVDKMIADFRHDDIKNGSYVPSSCNPIFSVAIIVTYRNRESQLQIFLPYMHNFLRKQDIHYKIYLVEQQDDRPWNKGVLYNIGAMLAMRDQFPCLVLHDVDLLPLDAANIYACSHFPRHMSASIDKFRYVLPYDLVGGVLSMRSEMYSTVNGFSNLYEGWGGEDDDFAMRLQAEMLPVVRFHPEISRYTMLKHSPEKRNPERYRLLRETRVNRLKDGLNSVRYHRLRVEEHQLYTLVGVETFTAPD